MTALQQALILGTALSNIEDTNSIQQDLDPITFIVTLLFVVGVFLFMVYTDRK